MAAYTDELGVTRRLDELGHVAFTYKASARSSRLYHVLFAEQNYYFATLYDHDLSGPKIEWVRPPSPGECWWARWPLKWSISHCVRRSGLEALASV